MKILAVPALAVLLASCATAPEAPKAPAATPQASRHMEMLVSFMTGTFASIRGLPGNADPTPVTLHQVRLWPERQGELWIYAEYAHPGEEGAPYRQRIYRFQAVGDDMLGSTYRLPGEPRQFVQEWRKEKPFAGVDPASLAEREGCGMRFVVLHEALFGGKIQGERCPGEAKEVAYEVTDFFISSSSLRIWDRGFDAAGRQVWGSKAGPLEMRRVSEQQR